MFTRIQIGFHALQLAAQRHKVIVHRAHEASHVSYLSLVVAHGPYHYPALVLLVLVVLGWILKIDVE